MFKNILKAFSIPDIRKRILYTFSLLLIIRIIEYIPLPAISTETLKQLFSSSDLLGLLNIFSGGALAKLSIGFMGVGPYITASIVIQLLTFIVPSLEQLQKEEGEAGRQKINQYTRLLTVPLAIIQSFSLLILLRNQKLIGSIAPIDMASILVVSTATSILFMWLGEIISEQGVGNGISLIIAMGILAGIPLQGRNTAALVLGGGMVDPTKIWGILAFILITIFTIIFIVVINEAVRKVPVSYARGLRSGGRISRVDNFLPLKMNAAGVIPIIFALSIMVFPPLLGRFLEGARSSILQAVAKDLIKWFNPNQIIYSILYFLLVVAFTYFYTGIVFKPKDIAENLQKNGGFIPGIRPGSETASFLARVVNRITLPGSIFLGVIAVLPFIVQSITKITTLVIGGTGILIVVSVVLETSDQLKAHILTSEYESYE